MTILSYITPNGTIIFLTPDMEPRRGIHIARINSIRIRRIEFGQNLILFLIQDIDVAHINEVWSNLYLADIAVSGIKIGTHLTLDTEIKR